ncbi:MAG: hypothetical protein K8T10_10150 [Candidatus Eremiobacteraeota bacterium]|nr:hypothetical protein [Candidatus Eremiobacteraeota bacterium]
MMNEQCPPELTALQGLMNAIGKKCPECSEVNPSGVLECEFCGAALEEEREEEPSISLLQEVGVGSGAEEVESGFEKVPLEESENLLLLQDTVDALKTGEVTYQDYKKYVSMVLNTAKNGVEIFQTDMVKKQLSTMSDEIRVIAEDTALYYREFYDGCLRMMEYNGDNDISPATEGLGMVETALRNMDGLHDRIITKARKIDEEEKEK